VVSRITLPGTDPAIREAAGHEVDLADIVSQIRINRAS
jgi:hypothetical protein